MTEFYEKVEYIVVAITLAIALYLIISVTVSVFLEGESTATETVETRSQNHIILEEVLNSEDQTPRSVFTEEYILNTGNIDFKQTNEEEHCYIEEIKGLDGENTALALINTNADEDMEDFEVFERCSKTHTQRSDALSRITIKTATTTHEPAMIVYEIQ